MNSELLCKDCKHSFRTIPNILAFGWSSSHTYLCRKSYKEEMIEHNPVTGPKRVAGKYENCNLVRLHDADYKKNCGKEGRWWEPKNKKFMFLEIKHSGR